MPGVLTVEEIKKLDLGSWPLVVHGSFVHMAVSLIPILTIYNCNPVIRSVSTFFLSCFHFDEYGLTMTINYRT